jgi:hypothetical protein
MRHIHRPLAVGFLALLVTACFGGAASPSAGQPSSAPVTASADASASAAPVASEIATTEPIPSEDLGPFTCDLPIHIDATVALANLTATRIGQHDGYDRVVFEFEQGIPEVSIERDEPPFTEDASGAPLEVDGSSFLRVTMRGGTAQMEDGSSSYDGASAYDPEFDTLTALVRGGDFEAQSTWYVGMTNEACVRIGVLTEDGAPRLVIDLEH